MKMAVYWGLLKTHFAMGVLKLTNFDVLINSLSENDSCCISLYQITIDPYASHLQGLMLSNLIG